MGINDKITQMLAADPNDFAANALQARFQYLDQEFKSAIALIPAPVQLLEIQGAGHDLGRDHSSVAAKIALSFLEFEP